MVLIARILLFLQLVLIAAALGAVVAFLGLILIGTLLGASNMEGGLAMGAAGLSPAGALVGAVLGAWLAWRLIARIDHAATMFGGFGLFAFAGLCAGGWLLYQELTDGDPYPTEAEPMVAIEWRIPEIFPHQHVDRVFRFTLRSSYMDWTLSTQWDEPRARNEDGRTILRFRGWIRWRVTGRIFQLWRAPHHDDRITVDLGLPRDPQPSDDYGEWQEVDGAPGNAFRWRVIGKLTD